MQDFFDSLGKRINDTLDEVGKRAEDTMEVQKYKSEVRSLKRGNERDMYDIGRIVYERFKDGDIVDLDFVALCEAIEKRDQRIEECKEEIERIKGMA